MPCEPIFSKGRISGWICHRSRGKPKPPPCYKCGKPATCLCDHRELDCVPDPMPDPLPAIILETRYIHNQRGKVIHTMNIPRLDTCNRPMCAACANHTDPDTDICDEHNNETAKARSAVAEYLHRERLRAHGFYVEEEPTASQPSQMTLFEEDQT